LRLDGSSYVVLHRFRDPAKDGSFPSGLAAFNSALYGTTYAGGKRRSGTVFRMSFSGDAFSTVHFFVGKRDGASPNPELSVLNGTFFGTTMHGGNRGPHRFGDGTIFAIDAQSSYRQLYSVLYGMPEAGVIPVGNRLFGTTATGGLPDCPAGCGTIFRLAPNGNGFKILRKFDSLEDADAPESNLVVSGGVIYSGSAAGGANGVGTVFRIRPSGTGYGIVYSFKGGSDGEEPGTLVPYARCLYGTASGGKGGVIFRLVVR
jgi:uncharacterized repeat protein (TIGR03803 family)